MAVIRRLATPADKEFARQCHHRAYREIVEQRFGPWDEEWQDRMFDRGWADHDREMVEDDGMLCGYLQVDSGVDRVAIKEIVVHPDHQNQGIGTTLVQQTIDQAAARGLPVFLQVIKGNRAVRLYERLGFVEYGTTETHRLMRCDPLSSNS